jgi:hypothetical protein
VPINLTASGPVTEPPSFTLSYTIGNVSVDQPLKVPVASHRFVVPEAGIAKELFFEQWKSIGDPANRAQEMVARDNGPIDVADVPEVLRSANLGVEPGYLDPSPFNEAGAGYFVCQPAGGGEPTRTLVMVGVRRTNMTLYMTLKELSHLDDSTP